MKKLLFRPFSAAISAMLTFAAASAHAQELVPVGQIDPADSGDTAWMLIASALVLLAGVGGLGCSFASRLSTRSSRDMLLQIGGIVAAVSTLWVIVGYTLAFGIADGGIIGSGNAWMLIGLSNVRQGLAIPESAFALYQIAFAVFAAVLLTGAWAGRARFGWALATATLWSLIVYAPVSHWVWGGGWLAYRGAMDFSGGLVLHFCAGVSALTGAIMIGRRHHSEGTGHEVARPLLLLTGAGLLWAAWIGFAGGSALTANDNAAAAIINAHVAASTGGLAWLLIEKFRSGAISLSGFAKGVMAGLVTVSAATGYVSPGGAMVTGLLAAPICYFATRFVADILGVDDASDIFAVHGIGGLAGALVAAVFINPALGGTGFLEGMGTSSQLIAQLTGILAIGLWSAIGTAITGLGISIIIPMRISSVEEINAAREETVSEGMMPAE